MKPDLEMNENQTEEKPTQGTNSRPVGRLVSLSWSEPAPPCKACPYDHTRAETPFGSFLLTWKGWKTEPWQDPQMSFDETPWGEGVWGDWDTIEEAQKWAAEEMEKRIEQCFQANARAEESENQP